MMGEIKSAEIVSAKTALDGSIFDVLVWVSLTYKSGDEI